MHTQAFKPADERRAAIRAHANSLGVDDGYISLLVDTFYGHIRSDPVLGPIFATEISGDWEPHLKKMKLFWASVAMNAGSYSGKPVPAHQKLQGVSPEHFDRWLALFRSTLMETAPSPEVIPYLMERAERIAERLKLAMFGHLEITGLGQ